MGYPDSNTDLLAEQRLDLADEEWQDCPQCGARMSAIRGSKAAICANCGFKDSCCY